MNYLTKKIIPALLLLLSSPVLLAQVKKKISDKADKRTEFEFSRSKDPATGTVPTERLVEAIQAKNNIIANRTSLSGKTNVVSWVERGANNCGGLTRAVMYDPTDATNKRVFAGGAGGGIWRCDDINAYAPTWTKMNDQYDNLAVTCFAYNPLNKQEMYAGTGNGFMAINSMRGLGIFKTTDGGNTWTLLPFTKNNTDFYYVTEIGIDGFGQIYASTNGGGIQKSRDGGATWTKILGVGVNGASSNAGGDVEVLPNGTVYASFGLRFSQASVWKSVNGGTSFTDITPGDLASISYEGRIEIESAPTNNNKIIIIGQNEKMYKSSDGGSTWGTTITLPSFSNSQGWHNLLCEISPVDENTIFIGGLDPYRSTNGGTSWTQLSYYNNYSINNPVNIDIHGDLHHIVFNPANPVSALWASDGGIFLTDDMNGTVTFNNKNKGLNITQYYSAAINPVAGSNLMLAGAQDNSTHSFTSSGLNDVYEEIPVSDGGFAHIDRETPELLITSGVYHTYKYALNGFGSFIDMPTAGGAGTPNFINPTAWDHLNNTLYTIDAGGYIGYKYDGLSSWAINEVHGVTTGIPSAIAIDPNINNQVWMVNSSTVYKMAGANTGSPSVTSYTNSQYTSGSKPSCIEIEPGNSNHILLTYSNFGTNNIIESTNGGTTWTTIDGNLPDMPVYWIIFNPYNSDQAIIATEVGVWETDNLNGSSTIWVPAGNNFPNTKVYMLKLRVSDKTIVAASHGRGIWTTTLSNLTDCGTSLYISSINSTSATLNWDANINAPNYKVEYKLNSNSTWTTATNSTSALQYNLTGLTSNTLYDCRVTPNCSTGGTPAIAQFSTTTTLCDIPTGLTSTSTSLTWTAVSGASSYTLQYKLSTAGEWTSIKTTGTSFLKGNLFLQANSTYDWQLRTNCVSFSSAFTAGSSFTTGAACTGPTALTSSSITSSGAVISWSFSGTGSFRVEYKLSSNSQWVVVLNNSTATSYTFSDLAANSLYDWRIRNKCVNSYNVYSPVQQAQFTTLTPSCGAPSALTSSSIQPRSVTLSWTGGAGAIYYQVEYKTNSCSDWTNVIDVTGTTVNLTNLNPTHLYDWRVRTVCNGNTTSYVSAQFTTTTPSTLNIYGNVWYDDNGLTDNKVNRNPTPWPGINNSLLVYLINVNTNLVVQVESVLQDGTYSFPDVALNFSYKIILTWAQAYPGQAAPAIWLPNNWQYKGEYVGECPGTGSDGTVDGKIFINTTNQDIYNANFGIREPSGSTGKDTGRPVYVAH